jgi:hypothetical protein
MLSQSIDQLPLRELGSCGQYWRLDLDSLNDRLDFYKLRLYLPAVFSIFLGVIKPIGFLIAPVLGLLGWLVIQFIRRKRGYWVINVAKKSFMFYRGALRNGHDLLLQEFYFDDCLELASGLETVVADDFLAEQVLKVRTKSGETHVLTRFKNIKKPDKWSEHLYPSGEHPVNARLRAWMSEKTGIRDAGFSTSKQ